MAKQKKKVTTTIVTEIVSTDEKTLIAAILDRSGSMGSIIDDAIGGFNEFVENQQKLDDNASMTVALFDDRYDLLYEDVDVQKVKKITRREWSPRGLTALYDAIGTTINTLDDSIAKMKKKDRPNKILVAIVTDGLENRSREFTADQIKTLIKKKEQEDWQFVYLAAGQNAFEVGTSLGFSGGNTFTYTNTSVGNAVVFDSLSNATSKFRGVSTKSANYAAYSSNLFEGDKNNLNDKDAKKVQKNAKNSIFDNGGYSGGNDTGQPNFEHHTTTTNTAIFKDGKLILEKDKVDEKKEEEKK